jgi:hypothetical protein
MTEKELIVKENLIIFFNENKRFLTLDTPFEKWNGVSILFSSNDSIKGKVSFRLKRMEFKLKHKIWMPYTMSSMLDYNSRHWFESHLDSVKNGEFIFPSDTNGTIIYEKIQELCVNIRNAKEKFNLDQKRKAELEQFQAETKRKQILQSSKSRVLLDLDRNGDGSVDLVENALDKLLNKNQKAILLVDKNYIHQFVKVSNFIKAKGQNVQMIFQSIQSSNSQGELNERMKLLKNQIHFYELLVFHSVNMIGSLISEDLITFYEIYELFDKFSIFNSNWENEVSERLQNIGDKLDDIMLSIDDMERNIVEGLNSLSYVTRESFVSLNSSVTDQLKQVESSINTGNLISTIQSYQLYKINKKI